MTTAAKKVTTAYSDEQTATFKKTWEQEKSKGTKQEDIVTMLTVMFAKNAKSVISKASREGLYVAKGYVRKDGQPAIKKENTAKMIGKMLNLADSDTESLEKANKSALEKISNAIAHSIPLEDLNQEDQERKNAIVEKIQEIMQNNDFPKCEDLHNLSVNTLEVLEQTIS